MNMKCDKCKTLIPKGSKFCKNCGLEIEVKDDTITDEKLVDRYFFESKYQCQYCGSIRPLRRAHYYKNIGMLIVRQNNEMEGDFCKECHNKLFIEYFLTCIFLGWWGVISLLITPFYLIFNLWSYIPTLWMQKEFSNENLPK